MEGFDMSKKMKPTDEPRSIEMPRESKLEIAARNVVEKFQKKLAEMSVGQSFETERSF